MYKRAEAGVTGEASEEMDIVVLGRESSNKWEAEAELLPNLDRLPLSDGLRNAWQSNDHDFFLRCLTFTYMTVWTMLPRQVCFWYTNAFEQTSRKLCGAGRSLF